MQSTPSIAQQRLYNQLIAGSICRSPVEVVGGAVQTQDFLGALWAIGLRVKAATESDVEQSLANRQIVRTWPMRGTLHFVLSADVRWMLELLTPRIVARWAARTRQLELDDKELVRSAKTLGDALRGNKQIPRDALYRLLESDGISTKGQRGPHILGLLAMQGLVCFGTRAGKQQRFALLDEWVPNAKRLERDEALARLAFRYFTGHGPATLQDFAWWSGLTISDAAAGLDFVRTRLAHEKLDGETYWFPQNGFVATNSTSHVYLLPSFDEYLVGYKNRDVMIGPEPRAHVFSGNMFNPVIVAGGQVKGTWKRTLAKRERHSNIEAVYIT